MMALLIDVRAKLHILGMAVFMFLFIFHAFNKTSR